MKYLLRCFSSACLIAGFASTTVHAQTIRPNASDERAIRELIASHAAASQHDDFANLVGGYHADADVRRPDGSIVSGKAAIEQIYRDVLSGGSKRMAHTHPPESIRIRFLRPDVAFVDVASVPAAEPAERIPYFLVFTKQAGKWGVAVERSGIPLK